MIQLDSEWRIEFDENNVELIWEKEVLGKNKKTGEEKMVTQSKSHYYPHVKSALKRYLQEELKDTDSIEQILERINEVETKIDNIKLK